MVCRVGGILGLEKEENSNNYLQYNSECSRES